MLPTRWHHSLLETRQKIAKRAGAIRREEHGWLGPEVSRPWPSKTIKRKVVLQLSWCCSPKSKVLIQPLWFFGIQTITKIFCLLNRRVLGFRGHSDSFPTFPYFSAAIRWQKHGRQTRFHVLQKRIQIGQTVRKIRAHPGHLSRASESAPQLGATEGLALPANAPQVPWRGGMWRRFPR